MAAKLLVVDDDAGLVRLMQKTLRREGFEVDTALSGTEAQTLLKSGSYTLLLLDLKLPDMSGAELVTRLGLKEAGIPFAVITGQGDERVAVEMMKQGAVDYLVKDAEFLDLIPHRVRRAVDNLLQKHQLIEAEGQRRRLEKEILEISAREQRRIGQDLHDGLGQHLTGIELMSQAPEQSLARKKRPEADEAAKIARHVREAIVQAKNLARGLSPVELEGHGLMSALQELCRHSTELMRIRCDFVCPAPVLIESNEAATNLYRIAQEAINNAVKHGRARHVQVQLTEDGAIRRLAIIDDGAGFSPQCGGQGMGLRIMSYRASMIGAAVELLPNTPHGTQVICSFKADL